MLEGGHISGRKNLNADRGAGKNSRAAVYLVFEMPCIDSVAENNPRRGNPWKIFRLAAIK